MQLRVSTTLVVFAWQAIAAAEPETPQLTHSEIDRENHERLQADQQRLEQERLRVQHERVEQERTESLQILTRSEFDRQRVVRESHRRTGYKLAVTAGVFGVVAGVAGYLGSDVNHQITRGGLGTPDDINNLVDRGKIYNYTADGTAIVGGIFAVIAIPLILFNLDPGEYEVTPTVSGDAKGLSLAGRF